MCSLHIQVRKEEEFTKFLGMHDFEVDDLGEGIYRIVRGEELPVFAKVSSDGIYFEVDLGNISEFADKDFYFNLLDLNTEILPVSFGINNTNPDDPHLVLVESREIVDLNDHELLSVFDALELAVDKAQLLLERLMKQS